MLLIAKEVYESGYQITGENNRIDIINPERKKECEIFFFEDNILIMTLNIVKWTTYTDIELCVINGNLTIAVY